MISPKEPWHRFLDAEEKLTYLKRMGLIPKTLGLRPIYYAGFYTSEPVICDVVGYVNSTSLILSINDELHCIHPELLREMQPKKSKKEKVSKVDTDGSENINLWNETQKIEPAEEKTMFDFVAIDFETATGDMSSACSVGIVAVKDFAVADSFYSLIQPPNNRYDSGNIAVHHITPHMTVEAPTLTDLWSQISRFFDAHVPVVAHNAHFDMSVLRLSTDVDIPNFCYVDSMNIAAPHVGGSLSLSNCAEEMGISCEDHHNAMNDAEVCARLVIEALRRENCLSLWEYIAKDVCNPEFFAELRPMKKFGTHKKKQRFENIRPSDIHQTVECIDEGNPLYGKSIVFTGQLSMDRAEAMQIAVNCGAIVKSGVSRKTDYLIVGMQDKALVGEDGLSSKEEKAYELNASGVANIVFLSEDEFIQLAKGEVTV